MSATLAGSFNLREADAGEGASILPCYEWLFAGPGSTPPNWQPGSALERLERVLADDQASVFVAEAGELDAAEAVSIVGFCSVYIDIESVRYGLRGWVEDLAIAPEQRSGGIGTVLLRAARDWARERGASHLELDSGIRRVDAHRFYERQNPAWSGLQYTWQL